MIIDTTYWQEAAAALSAGEATLLSIWGEPGHVHMAVLHDNAPPPVILTLECPDNKYPSVGAHHAPAIRLERTLRDLFGIEPIGLPDPRPWLDHTRLHTLSCRWKVRAFTRSRWARCTRES
jgi:hypothetical protein